jgi:hypothetical protein
MTLWKVYCEEEKYPGMWQRWFLEQCVGIGWPPQHKYRIDGPTKEGKGWRHARKALKAIEIGDHVVVALHGHRVGRIGEVTGKAISDAEWNPLVPKSGVRPEGEMGRRILVRWDLTIGPESRDMVVKLPPIAQLNLGELRSTIAKVRSQSIPQLTDAMKDSANWVGLLTHFRYEKALSDYIAAYPHRLEDGLFAYPDKRVRERVFRDRSRLDVLLIDRKNNTPVIVECKQGHPTSADLKQIRHYMALLREETDVPSRGILVHGGARKLRTDIAAEARKNPKVEIVKYSLNVDFASSN